MADENTQKTITVGSISGKKKSSSGADYWEIIDTNNRKYRVSDPDKIGEFKPDNTYTVSVRLFSGTYKGKTFGINYIDEIIIADVPLNPDEPIDAAIGQLPKSATAQHEEKYVDPEARGKVRNTVAGAILSVTGPQPIDRKMEDIMEGWVEYIMNGPLGEDLSDINLEEDEG